MSQLQRELSDSTLFGRRIIRDNRLLHIRMDNHPIVLHKHLSFDYHGKAQTSLVMGAFDSLCDTIPCSVGTILVITSRGVRYDPPISHTATYINGTSRIQEFVDDEVKFDGIFVDLDLKVLISIIPTLQFLLTSDGLLVCPYLNVDSLVNRLLHFRSCHEGRSDTLQFHAQERSAFGNTFAGMPVIKVQGSNGIQGVSLNYSELKASVTAHNCELRVLAGDLARKFFRSGSASNYDFHTAPCSAVILIKKDLNPYTSPSVFSGLRSSRFPDSRRFVDFPIGTYAIMPTSQFFERKVWYNHDHSVQPLGEYFPGDWIIHVEECDETDQYCVVDIEPLYFTGVPLPFLVKMFLLQVIQHIYQFNSSNVLIPETRESLANALDVIEPMEPIIVIPFVTDIKFHLDGGFDRVSSHKYNFSTKYIISPIGSALNTMMQVDVTDPDVMEWTGGYAGNPRLTLESMELGGGATISASFSGCPSPFVDFMETSIAKQNHLSKELLFFGPIEGWMPRVFALSEIFNERQTYMIEHKIFYANDARKMFGCDHIDVPIPSIVLLNEEHLTEQHAVHVSPPGFFLPTISMSCLRDEVVDAIIREREENSDDHDYDADL